MKGKTILSVARCVSLFLVICSLAEVNGRYMLQGSEQNRSHLEVSMKAIFVLYTLLFQLPVLQCASPSRQHQKQRQQQTGAITVQNQRERRAGTYLGLTAGKSTRADVLRVLGEPKRLETPADQTLEEPNPEVWYVYDNGGEFAGELTVVIDKRTDVVLGINLNPDSLSKEEAVKHFGPDYILTRYNFDDCLGNEESAPLYESANGPLLEVEYRHRGIAISLTKDGKVNTISYVGKPIGTLESRCHPPSRKKALTKRNRVTGRYSDGSSHQSNREFRRSLNNHQPRDFLVHPRLLKSSPDETRQQLEKC